MLGICPNCKISLKEPPFSKREMNEVMLVLNYRKMVENNLAPKSFEELGYCELCNASRQDHDFQKTQKNQKKSKNNPIAV